MLLQLIYIKLIKIYLFNILTQLRRPPTDAIKNCLGVQLLDCERYKRRVHSLRNLIQLRPQCMVPLSRLFISILVYDAVRRNNQSYRQKPSVIAGMCHCVKL